MRLIHYSSRPLDAVQTAVQRHSIDVKPNGLWVSVEGPDDWPSWCRSENYHLEKLACATEVVLVPSARMLVISSVREIDNFHAAWAMTAGCPAVRSGLTAAWPEWHGLAARYDGIIIAPYLWSRRYDGAVSAWYYSWDCASGCIWRAEAVAELRPLP